MFWNCTRCPKLSPLSGEVVIQCGTIQQQLQRASLQQTKPSWKQHQQQKSSSVQKGLISVVCVILISLDLRTILFDSCGEEGIERKKGFTCGQFFFFSLLWNKQNYSWLLQSKLGLILSTFKKCSKMIYHFTICVCFYISNLQGVSH